MLNMTTDQGVHHEADILFWKSPLTPLFQIPRNAGLPFVKGGKGGNAESERQRLIRRTLIPGV